MKTTLYHREVGFPTWVEENLTKYFLDGFEKELGYFTLSELEHAKDGASGLRALPIERDRHYGFEHTLAEVK